MNKKILLGLVLISLFLLFAGCESKVAKSEKTEDLPNNTTTKQAISTTEALTNNNTTQQPVSISENEFDVNYKGTVINAKVSFDSIAKQLGIKIDIPLGADKDDSNTEVYAAVDPYVWYKVHYPSKENEELCIEYVHNEETGENYIVYVNLFEDTATYRDIKVGDSLEKFLKAYSGKIYANGDNADTRWYYYVGDESNKKDYSGMCVLTGKNSKKIEEISIDYNITKARDDMQLYGD